MIRIIEHALKECITKSMLRSYRPIELFYENKFSESDGVPRKTWQVINELTSRKTGRSSVKGVESEWCFNNELDRFVKRFQ